MPLGHSFFFFFITLLLSAFPSTASRNDSSIIMSPSKSSKSQMCSQIIGLYTPNFSAASVKLIKWYSFLDNYRWLNCGGLET